MTIGYLQRAAACFEPPERHEAAALMMAAGLTPDPWQANLMRARPERALLLSSRQAGKSMTVGAIALEQALNEAASTSLLISPSQRQSAELLGKVRMLAMARQTRIELEQLSVLSMRPPTAAGSFPCPVGRRSSVGTAPTCSCWTRRHGYPTGCTSR